MTVKEIIMTITGAAIFSFLVITVWGKLVNLFGAIGGFIAAMLIPGTMWIVNHGVNNHLIKQKWNLSGLIWLGLLAEEFAYHQKYKVEK